MPEAFTNLLELRHLDLSSNDLNGPMPEFIGNMTKLEYVFLANNSFVPGPIPESWANLTRLEELSVKRTQREGNLPEWMGDLENLLLLDMDQNNFVGPIPASYGRLRKLQFLMLNRNDIEGVLPASFVNLTELRAVFLEGNALEGDLEILCDLPNFQETPGDRDGTEILAADCLQGSPLNCSCCTHCCPPRFPEVEGLEDETTCTGLDAIVHLDPIWENGYRRTNFDFGNETRFTDRDYLN